MFYVGFMTVHARGSLLAQNALLVVVVVVSVVVVVATTLVVVVVFSVCCVSDLSLLCYV